MLNRRKIKKTSINYKNSTLNCNKLFKKITFLIDIPFIELFFNEDDSQKAANIISYYIN